MGRRERSRQEGAPRTSLRASAGRSIFKSAAAQLLARLAASD